MADEPPAGRMAVWLVAVFLFNIIVGTGAFALPHLFAEAGLALGTIFIIAVTGLAFASASFVVEAQAVATLLKLARHAPSAKALAASDPDAIPYVDQTSTIIAMIMPGWGTVLWYVTIILYLATDLAVYAVFIPSTLRGILSDGIDLPTGKLQPQDIYSVCLVILGVVTTPMVFFSLKKTTLLQVSTTIVRHAVFWTMIGTAIAYLPQSCALIAPVTGATCHGVEPSGCAAPPVNVSSVSIGADGTQLWTTQGSQQAGWASTTEIPKTVVKEMNLSAIPLLFGGAVYALMCQQYIAAMVAPIASRRWATPAIGVVFGVVIVYYLALCWTAVTAFDGTPMPPPPMSTTTISGGCQCTAQATLACPPQSLYTLNFGYLGGVGTAIIVAPLLSLLSSFPVIAITLRDNMMVLYWYISGKGAKPERDPLVVALSCCRCCLAAQRAPEEPDLDAASAMGETHDAWESPVASPRGTPTPGLDLERSSDRGQPLLAGHHHMAPLSIQHSSGAIVDIAESVYSDAQHHHGPTVGELREYADVVAGAARFNKETPASTKDAPLALRILFGCIAVFPAFLIAALTDDVDILVGITGGYGGALIMYVIPALLLLYSRRIARAIKARVAPDAASKAAPDLTALGIAPGSSAVSEERWAKLQVAAEHILTPSLSFVPNEWWALAPALFGLACIAFNTYNLIAG
ncbi:hypothetical protein FNF31_04325 [Cafeteria roenbergensis]|uniref:Amino acid transporter transmembrane domain-containing protein n=3 Tax=Cafeteria roenbergensis TaxID=33653 RepID=A0A5A8D514_CAFRO|nr:hypothetical protein FNF31_04325 [Cafeteria roenbergensis]